VKAAARIIGKRIANPGSEDDGRIIAREG